MFSLKGSLEHLPQEQDQEGFDGERQDYIFGGVTVTCTKGFANRFEDDSIIIMSLALHMIHEMSQERERLQRFKYDNTVFWCISNWEAGTNKEDYDRPEELCVVFLLPSEY